MQELAAAGAQKSGCAWLLRVGSAQSTAPSALPGSAARFGRFSHPPNAPNGLPQRALPTQLAAKPAPKALTARRRPAVMTSRDATLRADEAAASHRAADGACPSIPCARTYARATSTGAVAAVSCVWSSMPPCQLARGDAASPKLRRAAKPGAPTQSSHAHGVHVAKIGVFPYYVPLTAWPNG